MRSTNIILFLVLMNGMAAVVGLIVPGVAPAVGGGQTIEQQGEQSRDQLEPQRQGSGVASFIGGVLSAFSFLGQIQSIIFLGPEMLANIGVPSVITSGFKLVVGILVSIDLAEVLSGRQLG